MKPEINSQTLLSITRSKAKMYEYNVPEKDHIIITRDPARLFSLAVGLLGDLAAQTNTDSANDEQPNELINNLQFSARFFDSYLESKLQKDLDPYLILLGSASYYLCGLPGSSRILATRLGNKHINLEGGGLEQFLLHMLQWKLTPFSNGTVELYKSSVDNISNSLMGFYANNESTNNIRENAKQLRQNAYKFGTPRQLLFADTICAVLKRRLDNSAWYALPRYSGIPVELWTAALKKESFVKELWPAQHLLGQKGVFKGKSAMVQMPTSAGKTRATEMVIRSAFLSGRTSLAVIVAPFRALCHEIKDSLLEEFRNEQVNIDELTDILQADFDMTEILGAQQIIIVTPEKLLFVLRNNPEMAQHIGLLIYDEGHQFDSGERGINYELLITSLKSMVPQETQTLLISAVISNAELIGRWLNGGDFEVVTGFNLNPTFRTIGFTSWIDTLGQIRFVKLEDPDQEEFFVPRIIEQQLLKLEGRERNPQAFPEKTDGGDIALFMGLKLVKNGSVAIFCGRKDSVVKLCDRVLHAYSRGLTLTNPKQCSNPEEIERLNYLYTTNLGSDCSSTKCANLGIFTHHGSTPPGIRLAVEHALKKDLIKFVICTSTLAQGVNLPIRYLIVTNLYQGLDLIKVRDFHNLIGRAGRAGMHTEGSILFADPKIYDTRNTPNERWRWKQVKNLLKAENSEPCASTLLSFFDPIKSDKGMTLPLSEAEDFISLCLEHNDEKVTSFVNQVLSMLPNVGFTKESIEGQLSWKINILSAVENYLMANWDLNETALEDEDIEALAKGTLAYFLSDDTQKIKIISLFNFIARNIRGKVSEPAKRRIFGRTLYDVETSIEIEAWVRDNLQKLIDSKEINDLLDATWPILYKNIQNNVFKKCDNEAKVKDVSLKWINGSSFYEIFKYLVDADVRLLTGKQRRILKIEQVVDMLEGGISYDGTLVINAISENIGLMKPTGYDELITKLQELQKRLRYGLPNNICVALQELGFGDRPLCIALCNIIKIKTHDKTSVKRAIKNSERQVRELLNKYPSYYTERLNSLI